MKSASYQPNKEDMYMHQNFADWYQPVTFGHDRNTMELRWKGIEAAVEDIDTPQLMELVRFVYGRPFESTEFMAIFRKYFKDNDSMFQSSGNDQEMLVLAGCVLALCTTEDYDIREVPLAILTSSFCKKKAPKVSIDLVRMATNRVRTDGINARKRPSMSKSKTPSFKKILEEEIKLLSDKLESSAVIAALQKMVSMHKTANEKIMLLQKLLNIQDEELQMLWWMVSGWSDMWNSTFDKIENEARPLLLAKEAASMSNEISESPSLKAVFSRMEIDGNMELAIPETVNSCGVERLKTLAPGNTFCCSTIYPMHFAIIRALETGADNTWIAGWSKISGIDKKTKVSSLDLALQFHRELQLMKITEEANA
jgi:hypothetical protein